MHADLSEGRRGFMDRFKNANGQVPETRVEVLIVQESSCTVKAHTHLSIFAPITVYCPVCRFALEIVGDAMKLSEY
jgi:hypothetical protein